jgi:hypothetical protein
MKLEFSQQILEKFLNFTKICPVQGELLHAGGRRDMTKLIVAFHQFAEAFNNSLTFSAVSNFPFPSRFSYENSASFFCLSLLCICLAHCPNNTYD